MVFVVRRRRPSLLSPNPVQAQKHMMMMMWRTSTGDMAPIKPFELLWAFQLPLEAVIIGLCKGLDDLGWTVAKKERKWTHVKEGKDRIIALAHTYLGVGLPPSPPPPPQSFFVVCRFFCFVV